VVPDPDPAGYNRPVISLRNNGLPALLLVFSVLFSGVHAATHRLHST